MRTLQWIVLMVGILLSLFWVFAFIVFLVNKAYLPIPVCIILLAIDLRSVIDNIKALSKSNGSSHEKSE